MEINYVKNRFVLASFKFTFDQMMFDMPCLFYRKSKSILLSHRCWLDRYVGYVHRLTLRKICFVVEIVV